MRRYLPALRFLPPTIMRIEFLRSALPFTALAFLLFVPSGYSVAAEVQASTVAELFAADEDILSENSDVVIRRASELPIDQRFDYLATWILPSKTHSGFRMKGVFEQTDPTPNLKPALNGSMVRGIVSPVFALIAVAKETGRLDELRRRLEAISDLAAPDQMRARVAMMFIVQVAQKDTEGLAESLVRLTEQVKTRGSNQSGCWWPETLALAFGIEHVSDMIEMNDLAATMFHVQIGQSRWSGSTAWDVFVSNCLAHFKTSERPPQNGEAASPDAFRGWIPSDVVTAESRGTGCPRAVWRHDGNLVHKLNGHNSDYLYFPIPLTGEFEVECDVSSFNYRETQMAYAGGYASHNWQLTQGEIGSLQRFAMIPLTPKMTYPDDWLTCRIAVSDNKCIHYINGRLLSQRELTSNQFPWLALRTYRISHGSIRNLTVTGNPIIPKSVSMCSGTDLNGWATYFQAAIDDIDNDSQVSSWRNVAGDDGEREILHLKRTDLAGTKAESQLMYHRPMAEDGVIEYEFFYLPDATLVHPAIDRLAFLLTPTGVRTHYVSDGQWQRDQFPPDNQEVVPAMQQKSETLPLKSNAWNHLQFALTGHLVRLRLNGTEIYKCTIDETNRRQFGLFHFADESSAKVRRMQWHGSWPMSVESSAFPPAARPDVGGIEAATLALPQSFHQDFRESRLPESGFVRKSATIVPAADGIAAECVGEGRRQSDLAVSLEIGGDFDLRAAFRNFQHSGEGDAGLEMAATLANTNHQIRLALNRFQGGDQKMKTQIGSLQANARWDYADTWRVCESNEGVLRMVRHGETLHFLFAESATSTFRLLHSAKVGPENLRLGDTVLSVFANRQAKSGCVWTSISVRAEKLSGPALFDNEKMVSELNEQRDRLPVSFSYDFTRAGPDPRNLYRWGDQRPWNAADMGLELQAEGAEGWTANGLMTRHVMDGDFDVRITFDPTELAKPTAGRYTSIFCQIQLQEDDRMRLASIFLRTPDEYKVVAQRHHTVSPGKDEYSWHGEVPVELITSLRIARHGRTYSMLAKAREAEVDRVIFQTEHSTGPAILHCLLHTGAVREQSRILLKTIEVHAEKYEPVMSAGE